MSRQFNLNIAERLSPPERLDHRAQRLRCGGWSERRLPPTLFVERLAEDDAAVVPAEKLPSGAGEANHAAVGIHDERAIRQALKNCREFRQPALELSSRPRRAA